MSKLALQLIAKEKIEKTGRLDLGNCGLTEIPKEILELEHLTTLDLRDNQISDISFIENLVRYNNFKRLDIFKNKITDLSPLLRLIKKGVPVKWDYLEDGICVEDNPLEHPPVEIVKQGNEAILKYFKSLEEDETIELYEAKMLIVGDGGVGKTSLLRKFIDDKNDLPQEEETTKGIDIHEYFFPISNEQDFRINL